MLSKFSVIHKSKFYIMKAWLIKCSGKILQVLIIEIWLSQIDAKILKIEFEC